MSITFPLFMSYGPDRPNFYAVLKDYGLTVRYGTATTLFGNPLPDPDYKLPLFRPSREFWGVREGTSSAAKTAATATTASAPTLKKVAPKAALGGTGAVLATVFRMAKRMLILDNGDEIEDSGWGEMRPLTCYGGLGGEKPKPT